MNILLIIYKVNNVPHNPRGDVNTGCAVQYGYIIIHGVGMAVMMGGEHETMNNKVWFQESAMSFMPFMFESTVDHPG